MKKVLVVGATGLIGQTVADTLAQEHEVVRSSRNDGERADMSDPASVRALFERVGPVDAVVSCAGAVPFKPLTELAAADYEAAVQDMLERTDHPAGRWQLVAGESKRFARVHVLETTIAVVEAGMRERGIEPPP